MINQQTTKLYSVGYFQARLTRHAIEAVGGEATDDAIVDTCSAYFYDLISQDDEQYQQFYGGVLKFLEDENSRRFI